MNALIEASSKSYHQRMVTWVNVALEEGVGFFLTSLGNPRWVVEAAKPFGGGVYHDVTERKWALKALEGGVHGLIAVRRAGGHAGAKSPEQLLEELGDLGVPLVCAGGTHCLLGRDRLVVAVELSPSLTVELRMGTLVRVPLREGPLERPIGAIQRRRGQLSEAARAFLATLEEELPRAG